MNLIGKRGIVYKLLSIFLVISFISFILLSYSVITILPPLRVKHLEVNVDNPALVKILRELLSEEFQNNILLVYLRKGLLERELQTRSLFYVKGITLQGFSFSSGTLKVDIETREPIAVLNGKFLVSPEGVLFGFIEPKADIKIEDFSRPWRYGEEYPRLDVNYLKELKGSFGVSRVEVKDNLAILLGNRWKVLVPLEALKKGGIEEILYRVERIVPAEPKEVALLGAKGDAYIKIIKERTDE